MKRKRALIGVQMDTSQAADPRSHEVRALVKMAAAGVSAGARDMEHLDGAAAAFNYVRIADLVSDFVASEAMKLPVLDWGCGYGQVSWLLHRRRVRLVSCDVEDRAARAHIPDLHSLKIDVLRDPVRLFYDPASFGAVLSVGVLEHVQDIDASIREVHRVLQPDGLFFVFMLPNKFSWAEWLADRRHISAHPRKFTSRETTRILQGHGFSIEKRWRRNFLPRNLTGLGRGIKQVYGRYYHQIETVDELLANCPPASFLSGVLEVIARKS